MPDPRSIAGLLPQGFADLPFAPFSAGVEIHRLWSNEAPDSGPELALLRYEPGASVPRHRHPGMETILVLSGSQSDERGRYPVGTLVVNPAGSEHSVWSQDGCVVLIQWEKPVEFIDAP